MLYAARRLPPPPPRSSPPRRNHTTSDDHDASSSLPTNPSWSSNGWGFLIGNTPPRRVVANEGNHHRQPTPGGKKGNSHYHKNQNHNSLAVSSSVGGPAPQRQRRNQLQQRHVPSDRIGPKNRSVRPNFRLWWLFGRRSSGPSYPALSPPRRTTTTTNTTSASGGGAGGGGRTQLISATASARPRPPSLFSSQQTQPKSALSPLQRQQARVGRQCTNTKPTTAARETTAWINRPTKPGLEHVQQAVYADSAMSNDPYPFDPLAPPAIASNPDHLQPTSRTRSTTSRTNRHANNGFVDDEDASAAAAVPETDSVTAAAAAGGGNSSPCSSEVREMGLNTSSRTLVSTIGGSSCGGGASGYVIHPPTPQSQRLPTPKSPPRIPKRNHAATTEFLLPQPSSSSVASTSSNSVVRFAMDTKNHDHHGHHQHRHYYTLTEETEHDDEDDDNNDNENDKGDQNQRHEHKKKGNWATWLVRLQLVTRGVLSTSRSRMKEWSYEMICAASKQWTHLLQSHSYATQYAVLTAVWFVLVGLLFGFPKILLPMQPSSTETMTTNMSSFASSPTSASFGVWWCSIWQTIYPFFLTLYLALCCAVHAVLCDTLLVYYFAVVLLAETATTISTSHGMSLEVSRLRKQPNKQQQYNPNVRIMIVAISTLIWFASMLRAWFSHLLQYLADLTIIIINKNNSNAASAVATSKTTRTTSSNPRMMIMMAAAATTTSSNVLPRKGGPALTVSGGFLRPMISVDDGSDESNCAEEQKGDHNRVLVPTLVYPADADDILYSELNTTEGISEEPVSLLSSSGLFSSSPSSWSWWPRVLSSSSYESSLFQWLWQAMLYPRLQVWAQKYCSKHSQFHSIMPENETQGNTRWIDLEMTKPEQQHEITDFYHGGCSATGSNDMDNGRSNSSRSHWIWQALEMARWWYLSTALLWFAGWFIVFTLHQNWNKYGQPRPKQPQPLPPAHSTAATRPISQHQEKERWQYQELNHSLRSQHVPPQPQSHIPMQQREEEQQQRSKQPPFRSVGSVLRNPFSSSRSQQRRRGRRPRLPQPSSLLPSLRRQQEQQQSSVNPIQQKQPKSSFLTRPSILQTISQPSQPQRLFLTKQQQNRQPRFGSSSSIASSSLASSVRPGTVPLMPASSGNIHQQQYLPQQNPSSLSMSFHRNLQQQQRSKIQQQQKSNTTSKNTAIPKTLLLPTSMGGS